jgi:L-serine dehydratase
MAVSVFDLFKIGIGPSSSHTVGPMRAAARFVTRWLDERGVLAQVARIRAELFGSLAHTGRGHGTDKAVLCGFEGEWPDRIDPDVIPEKLRRIRAQKKLLLLGRHEIAFDEKTDLVFNKRQKLPFHSNGMRFTAFDANGNELATRDYYSVGGGFVVNPDEAVENRIVADTSPLPYPFHSGDELLKMCEDSGKTIAQTMLGNERVARRRRHSRGLLTIWKAMQDCVARGMRETGGCRVG